MPNKYNEKSLLLSPKSFINENNEVVKEYVNKLEELLKNNEVYNIALSGLYGTGKSSIIKTFIDSQKNKDKKKYMVISIGSFLKNSNTNNDTKISLEELEVVDKIEQSILKQLVYKNIQEEMPGSKIRRIKNNNLIKIIIFVLIIIPIMLKFYQKTMLNNIFYIGYFILLGVLIYIFIERLINYVGFIKIKNTNYEIDFKRDEDLTFNKNLYEIVYIFKVNKFKAIIFEDIDRFPKDVVIKVIEELKELNTIINIALKDKVKFIYSFKDDIFNDITERSKFYDYILSPMILSSSYNSIIQFYSLMDECGLNKNELDNKIIGILTKYVTDIRTLKCIINDYILFKRILKIEEYNKLFAMCIFKNYYLGEYTNIFNDNNIINQKFKIINNQRNILINSKIDKLKILENEYEEKNRIIGTSLENLKRVFISKLCNVKKSYEKLIINDKSYTFDDFFNDDFDLDLLKERNIKVKDNYYSTFQVDKNKIDEFLKNVDYITNESKVLENDINKLKEEIKEINILKDIEIIKRYYENKETDLLDELIINEYLNKDTYIDYITSPTISRNIKSIDNKYILNVQHGIKSYNLKITNHEEIIMYLKDYFEDKYILNFELINYLISKRNTEELNKIINQFKNLNQYKIEFILEYYLNKKEQCISFVNILNKANINLFDIVIDTRIANKEYNIQRITEIIINSKNPIINNKEIFIKELERYLNNLDFIEQHILLSLENVRNNLLKINFKFNYLNKLAGENREFLYENNLYELNKNNIEFIFKKNVNEISLNDYIELKEYIHIIDYILNSFNTFAIDCYLNTNLKINNKNIIFQILSDTFISETIKKSVCEKEKFTLDLENINKELYNCLLKHNHVNNKINNVILLKDTVNDKDLIEFIINNDILKKVNIKKLDYFDKKFINNLLNTCIDKFLFKESSIILDNTIHKDNLFYKNEINSENIKYLINKNLIEKSKKYYQMLCKFNLDENDMLIYLENSYLEKGIKYIKNIMNITNIKILLKSKIVDDIDKLKLIKYIFIIEEININYFYIAFEKNIVYKIKINNNFMKNIFDDLKDNIKYEKEKDYITFEIIK